MKKIYFGILALLFATSFLITSCSKDDVSENFGTSTGNYLPLAINNEWNYNSSSMNSLNNVKIIGQTTFSGNPYFEYVDNSYTYNGKLWFAKKGAFYIVKSGAISVVENGITINIGEYEFVTLRDDYEINKVLTGSVKPKVSYSGNGQSGNLDYVINYTIKNTYKGIVELNGQTYPDVIKTSINQNIVVNGQTTNARQEVWFANNIGIIRNNTTSSDVNQLTEIVNYTIN